MRSLVGVVLLLTVLSVPARAEEASCVPTGEIVPVEPVANETALEQASQCLVVIAKERENKLALETWDGCVKTRALIGDVLAFCKNPLDPKVARVSGDDIAAAAETISQTKQGCETAVSTVTVQTAELPTAGVILEGLVRFIVARAKAEAMAFLIDHLYDQVCTNADGKGLFPASCEVLAAKPGGNAWGTLKVAFEKDFGRLPERAFACVAKRIGGNDTVQMLAYDAGQVARLLHEQHDPLHVVVGFRQAALTAQQCKANTVGCGMHLLGFATQLLARLDTTATTTTSPQREVKSALIVARRWADELVRLEIVDRASVDALVLTSEATKLRLQQVAAAASLLADAAGRFKAELKNADTPAKKLAAIAKAFRATTRFLESSRVASFAWLREMFPKDKPRIDELDRKAAVAIATADQLLDAYDKVADQKYAHVYVAIAVAMSALTQTKAGAEIEGKIRKLLPFIAEVAAATKPEEVERSLEAAAAPVGGGRAKRGANRRTLAVTALAGLTLGTEVSYTTSENSDAGLAGGLFVPVGIDLTWGLQEIHSVGVFLSVLDLGAIASFRTKDDISMGETVEDAPQIGWEQVVSPGLFFEWGIDRITLGAGVSMTPSLRKVTVDGAQVDSAHALRFGIFAAIDVTIFPF